MSPRPINQPEAPFRIALVGGRGRTGQAIVAAAAEQGVDVVAIAGRTDDLADGMRNADVVLDFSSPEATGRVVRCATELGTPLVIGTTGHLAEEKSALLVEARKIPTVWSGNYSVGVNLLFALTRHAAAVLGREYDVEIVETHHRRKKDAPSGTAVRLIEVLRAERDGADTLRHGREGNSGGRSPAEIGVHAIRGGDVVGDHRVIFAGSGERVELTHLATDRAIFARGALRAARWVRFQTPGVYSMQDVLGLH